ncbi:hypothetical protein PVK06_009512 [Gossypium arboreum]|uniref:RNase H type-1 domain-containing protein n=1 Tax=Gossypium arboreum TaxID=29729 RepID=A0ABR0QMS6_GOSAR|nr:hypothetical protein PVK06_009512 [Gossypium arboreum]
MVFEWTRSLHAKFYLHNFTCDPILPKRPRQVRWALPLGPAIKINVDGAYFVRDHSDGVGVVARDYKGFVFIGLVGPLRYLFCKPSRGKSFHHCLKFARGRGYLKVVI